MLNNKYKVLKVFFDDPLVIGGFQLREISRKVKIAPMSVKKYLGELEKEGLIVKKKHKIYPVYYGNRNNEYFRFLKKIDLVSVIKEIGLLTYLTEKCLPEVVILFGSGSKGEDVKGSDVDFFLTCKEKKLELEKFEKKLGRKINLFFSKNFKLSDELKNNIINGVILYGYLKVF